jgi:hypothetical protein
MVPGTVAASDRENRCEGLGSSDERAILIRAV